MTIDIVPHEAKFTARVAAFNERMREGGSKWGFYTDPEPDWIPKIPEAKSWREYYLAVENGEIVRGGYALKPQEWFINGEIAWVTDWQGPFTEAAIDARYSPLMLKSMRRMLKEYPLLFSLGHGGTDEPIVELLRKMNWALWGVPFCFHVLKPYRFLRLNGYLRDSALKRISMDLAAFTGLGAISIRAIQSWARISSGSTPKVTPAKAVEVARFEEWADELWLAHKDKYRCLAVRDMAMMNTLMPEKGWPGGLRLKVERKGKVIGWSVVHQKEMVADERFGNLKVALVTDCFSAPEEAKSVMAATYDYINSRDVDLAFANMCHPAWVEALKAVGFTILQDRRLFAISPKMEEKLRPTTEVKAGLHLTNMDGHGPHGFAENVA